MFDRTDVFCYNPHMIETVEKVWARAIGHVMGTNDIDRPRLPVLTLKQARVVLVLKTFWVSLHIITCIFIIANAVHHW